MSRAIRDFYTPQRKNQTGSGYSLLSAISLKCNASLGLKESSEVPLRCGNSTFKTQE